jgi:hypothetical protein
LSSLIIAGNTSGTITLDAPNVAGTTVLTLPTANGTVITTGNIPTGSVLQVVYGSTSTQVTTSSASYVDTGLTATITPSSASNKILVLANIAGIFRDTTNGSFVTLQAVRGSTGIGQFQYTLGYINASNFIGTTGSTSILDSPSSTSATTYKVQMRKENGGSVDVQRDNVALSTIVLMEIKG